MKRYNPGVPGSVTKDGWAAPPLSELIVRAPQGAAPHAVDGPDRVVAELLAVRTPSGRFLVPADDPAASARTLRSYNRLRPRRVRTGRAAIGWALRFGAAGRLTEPRRLTAPEGAAVLLDHLAAVLGEPRVVFAATEQGGSGFLTPVLQLFRPDGTPAGFAKVGWDRVTAAMIRTEADALTLAAATVWPDLRVPAVRWHGSWEGLEILVTAPMPARVRRLRPTELPPIEPLRAVAELDGPLLHTPVVESSYWADACSIAANASAAGRADLATHLEQVAREHGMVTLEFGRWHGDWVEWNLAKAGGALWAWDWAYSAPGVPFGFDLLQFFHLRHRILRGEEAPVALEHAAADATPGLEQLGLHGDDRRAVVALHRVEVLLREERARLVREELTT